MLYRFLITCFAITLLGAGCIQSIIPTPPTSSSSTGTPSPEGAVTFDRGFGNIPGRAPIIGEPRDHQTVTWIAKPPSLPSRITVLRKRQTLPNSTFLQNITTGLHIPAGLLQRSPTSKQLKLEWTDDNGYHWSYDAEYGRIGFVRSGLMRDALTVPSLTSSELMGQAAKTFLVDRGAFPIQIWGNPQLAFSWESWWKHEEQNGRCMTSLSVEQIRSGAQDAHVLDEDIPRLPQKNAACVTPEFPNRNVIQFNFNQDNQIVYQSDGSLMNGAEVIVRSDTQSVESGTFEMIQDVDRSNYPSISEQDMLNFLMRGGAEGFPSWTASGIITYNAFSQGLYRHDVKVNDERRTFYIPSVRAEGIVTFLDGSKRPLVTMIPLLPLDQYAGSETTNNIVPLP